MKPIFKALSRSLCRLPDTRSRFIESRRQKSAFGIEIDALIDRRD
jgi:hypothetical protein